MASASSYGYKGYNDMLEVPMFKPCGEEDMGSQCGGCNKRLKCVTGQYD